MRDFSLMIQWDIFTLLISFSNNTSLNCLQPLPQNIPFFFHVVVKVNIVK